MDYFCEVFKCSEVTHWHTSGHVRPSLLLLENDPCAGDRVTCPGGVWALAQTTGTHQAEHREWRWTAGAPQAAPTLDKREDQEAGGQAVLKELKADGR